MTPQEYFKHKPRNRSEIADFVEFFLTDGVPLHATCRCTETDSELGLPHQSQLDYVESAFLNLHSHSVYTACRNGGKSYAAGIVCVLDALFKPNIRIAVAPFQFSQGAFIHGYVLKALANMCKVLGVKGDTLYKWIAGGKAEEEGKKFKFSNGSEIAFFSGGKSQASVKGYHPHVLICDEADLFTSEQYNGLSYGMEGNTEYPLRFDTLSTNYTLSGDGVVMKQIAYITEWNKVRPEGVLPGRVFRTCLIDILVNCPDKFRCDGCRLWDYCKGRAKKEQGFYTIESALTQTIGSRGDFESQMMLLRPTNELAYFPNFTKRHILENEIVWDDNLCQFISFDLGGGSSPHACVICQYKSPPEGAPKNTPGTYSVLDGLEQKGQFENFLVRVKAAYPNILQAQCFVDPNASKVAQHQGARSDLTLLRSAGFRPRLKQLKREPTFILLNQLIDPAAGEPKIHINKRCKTLIQQVQAAEHSTFKGRIISEPFDPKTDHQLDCLRYIVGWTWGTYAKHNGGRNPYGGWTP